MTRETFQPISIQLQENNGSRDSSQKSKNNLILEMISTISYVRNYMRKHETNQYYYLVGEFYIQFL